MLIVNVQTGMRLNELKSALPLRIALIICGKRTGKQKENE